MSRYQYPPPPPPPPTPTTTTTTTNTHQHPPTPPSLRLPLPCLSTNLQSLTAKYFAEFNGGAFGGALSAVKVEWSQRLNSTAGVTKSSRRGGGAGGRGLVYSSVVELSSKVVDNEAKLKQVSFYMIFYVSFKYILRLFMMYCCSS